MIDKLGYNILRFLALIIIQVLILNNIDLSGFVTPYLYILAILLLPFETPKWLLLFIAFFSGLIIDVFSDTLGLHTFSAVLIAYLRPFVISRIDTQKETLSGVYTPLNNNFGLEWFIKYVSVLTVIYHIAFEFIEAFSFSGFIFTLLKAILSAVFTIILMLVTRVLIIKK